MISKVRTPIRLLEIPRRTQLRGSLFLRKNVFRIDGELLGLAQLAADDDSALERHACHPDDLGAALVDDLRGGDLRGAELEAHELVVVLRGLVAALRLAALAPGLLRRRLGSGIGMELGDRLRRGDFGVRLGGLDGGHHRGGGRRHD